MAPSISMEVNDGVKSDNIERNFDNKLIQAGEIYREIKSTLWHFGSNEPSFGLGGMILVMLNQRWVFKKIIPKPRENLYIRKSCPFKQKKNAFVFKIVM